MSNEITSLCLTKNAAQPILCFSPTELFAADSTGGFTHLWEISKPAVTAPSYTDPNPAGPVPPQGSNKSVSPLFNETGMLQSYGQFTGTASDVYTVIANVDNTYQWSKASVGTLSAKKNITNQPQLLEFGIQIKFFSTGPFTGYETWTFYVFKPQFNTGFYSRWQYVTYLDSIFFVNQLNTLRFLNGRTINTFAWSTDQVPMGLHMVMFHDHLFISEPNFMGVANPRTVMWSDLRNYMKFDTELFINEADQYTFNDDLDAPESYQGITGMAELNPIRIGFGPPRLCIYTSKSIYMIEYVGLPMVTNKALLNDKVGCAFPYALVASKHMHLFIAADNFYMMEKDGEAKPIGDRVFQAFMQLLTENVELRYRTFGYVDQVRREVWWVFCSTKSTGSFDTKVGYNYISDTWQFAQADEHSFLHCRIPDTIGQPIGSDTTIIGDDTTLIGDDGEQIFQEYRLYGQEGKQVSYEVLDPEMEIDQELAEPYLITGDIIYDPAKVVLMDGMYIHADYEPSSCAGVEVAISTRFGINEQINWTVQPKLWTRELKENKFSWPRASGKIFRLRFTFKRSENSPAVRNAQFFFWNEIVKGMNEVSEK